MKGYIHSLESFGTVDGPGIRFVIFFQGCPMRCLYCHNPDTWKAGQGREMTAEEVLERAEGVREFLKGGGITATGGEPLMQLEFLTELFRLAKTEHSFHTCLDTSGILYNENKRAEYDALMKYTDLVMLDIKHIDPDEHVKLTGRKQDAVIGFALYLAEMNIPVWIRHVLVPGITDKPQYLHRLGRFLGGLHNVGAVEVLPYHNMGEAKYAALGLEYKLKGTVQPTAADAARARELVIDGMCGG